MSTLLKPCPFCKYPLVTSHRVDIPGRAPFTMFTCGGCGAAVSFRPALLGPEAYDAWNHRAEIASEVKH